MTPSRRFLRQFRVAMLFSRVILHARCRPTIIPSFPGAWPLFSQRQMLGMSERILLSLTSRFVLFLLYDRGFPPPTPLILFSRCFTSHSSLSAPRVLPGRSSWVETRSEGAGLRLRHRWALPQHCQIYRRGHHGHHDQRVPGVN